MHYKNNGYTPVPLAARCQKVGSIHFYYFIFYSKIFNALVRFNKNYRSQLCYFYLAQWLRQPTASQGIVQKPLPL